MNEAEIARFRRALLELQSELKGLSASSSEAGATVELDQSRVGRLSRMDAMQAQQMALEATRRRQAQLQAIDSALRRIESGDYGFCFVCGDEIPAGRLTVDPAATRCLACVDKT